jgi:hypothetical protein
MGVESRASISEGAGGETNGPRSAASGGGDEGDDPDRDSHNFGVGDEPTL